MSKRIYVFIVVATMPYEGSDIVVVCSTSEKAEKHKRKIEKAGKHYCKEMERSDYTSNIEVPSYLHLDIDIYKMKVE